MAWSPTPVFLPEGSLGQHSIGNRAWWAMIHRVTKSRSDCSRLALMCLIPRPEVRVLNYPLLPGSFLGKLSGLGSSRRRWTTPSERGGEGREKRGRMRQSFYNMSWNSYFLVINFRRSKYYLSPIYLPLVFKGI